ncbi:uncharacterized protein LOC117123170 isoform X2 [Anneissia japonica]|uniref:uncharacterized protein LOC117123170 isoform X2 n=1 Tax=Anneissia japonica TaxID=1529436 RepID=UPI00142587BA|nr:uncharacterized protein LOC117123170 isoform X2 [Anneissia japonica]
MEEEETQALVSTSPVPQGTESHLRLEKETHEDHGKADNYGSVISKEGTLEVKQEEERVSRNASSLDAPSTVGTSVDTPLSQDVEDEVSETETNVPMSCSETSENPSSIVAEEHDLAIVKIKEEKVDVNDEARGIDTEDRENAATETECTHEEHNESSPANINVNTTKSIKDNEDCLNNTNKSISEEQEERSECTKTPSECSETGSEKLRNIRSARARERSTNMPAEGHIGTKPKFRNIRPGFTFEPGIKVEAMDYLNNWYAAKIVRVDWDAQEVQIHFEGWNARYDEWLDFHSERLRPVPRQSNRRDSFNEGQLRKYKPGEQVLARWTDCRFYPAKIISNNNGSYQVLFYDGIKKNVQAINIRDIPPSLQEKKAKEAAYEKEWTRAHSRRKMERSQSFESDSPTAPKRRLSGNNSTPVQSKRVRHASTSPRLKELSDVDVSKCWGSELSNNHNNHDVDFYSNVTDGDSDEEDFMMPANLDLEESDDEESKSSASPGTVVSDTKLTSCHFNLKVSRPRSLPTCAPSFGNGLQLMSEVARRSEPSRCGQVLKWHHYDENIYSRSRQAGSRIELLQQGPSEPNRSILLHNHLKPRKIDSETTQKDSRLLSSLNIPVQIPRMRPRYIHVDPLSNAQIRTNVNNTSHLSNKIPNSASGHNIEMTTAPIFSKGSVDQSRIKESHDGKGYSIDNVFSNRRTAEQQHLHPSLSTAPMNRKLNPAHSHSSCCKCLQHYVDIKFRSIETQLRKLQCDILSEVKCEIQSVHKDVLNENRKVLEDFKGDVVTETVACIIDEVKETIKNESKGIIKAIVRNQSSSQSELNTRKSGTTAVFSSSVFPNDLPKASHSLDDTSKTKHQLKGSIWCMPSNSNFSKSGPMGFVVHGKKDFQKSSPKTVPFRNKSQTIGGVSFDRSKSKFHLGPPADANHQSDRTMTSQNNQLLNSTKPELINMEKKALSQNMDKDLEIELEMSDGEVETQECLDVSKSPSDHTDSSPGERPSITEHDYQNVVSDPCKSDGKKLTSCDAVSSQSKECEAITQTIQRKNYQIPQPHKPGIVRGNGQLSESRRNRVGFLKEHSLSYPKYYQPSPLSTVLNTKRPPMPFLSTSSSRTGGPNYVKSGNNFVPSHHKIFCQESPSDSAFRSDNFNKDSIEMVIIGSHPYKMEIPKSVYHDIQNKSKSVTYFIRKLLSTLFTNEELASSRIDAGEVVWKSRRTFKNALDPFRLQVILMQAQKEFPDFNGDLLSDSMLREVINCKCRCAAFNNIQKD